MTDWIVTPRVRGTNIDNKNWYKVKTQAGRLYHLDRKPSKVAMLHEKSVDILKSLPQIALP